MLHRRVQSESSTGSTDSSRVRTTVTIQIENIEFDSVHCKMRINGRNCEENQYIKVKFSFQFTRFDIY